MNQQTTRAQSATEILKTAASTLGERGKQYDQAGKQERSMTAIVAAFNAIYPRNLLTVHMGWQFMSLVKMVRGATKPHADSALDQVAYAALAAEEVAEQLHSQEQLHEAYAQPAEEPKDVETINQLKAELAEQSDNTSYWRQLAIERAVELSKQSEREQLDIETINDLREELASCKALIDRLYKEKQGAEGLRTELEQVRRTNFNRSADLTTLEQVHQAALKELETVRGECISRGAQLAEALTRLQRVAEPACAHNTDEPKAPRPQYVDPFDQYGDVKPAPVHRLVGGHDSARGSLAYPQGKDAPTPQ